MKKPMLNAIQKARMSMAMASKKPKLNPGFDSLPKEVRMKILKSKKPKMAMMKKPMLRGGKFKSMPIKPGETKTEYRNRLAGPKGPQRYKRKQKARIKSGAASNLEEFSIQKKVKVKPKMAMKKPLKSQDPYYKKIEKKETKAKKKLTQAQEALQKDKYNKARRKIKSGARKAYKSGAISLAERKNVLSESKQALKELKDLKKPLKASKSATKSKAIERKAKKVMKNPDKKSSPRKVKAIQKKFNKKYGPGNVTVAGVKPKKSEKKIARKKKAIKRKRGALDNKISKAMAKGKDSVTNSMYRKQMAIKKKKSKIKKAM